MLDFTFESTDLSAFYFFGVYEEDIEAGTSRLVGSAPGQLRQGFDGSYPDSYTVGPQTSVQGLVFEMDVEWGLNGDGLVPSPPNASGAAGPGASIRSSSGR